MVLALFYTNAASTKRKEGTMHNCKRCGVAFQHNYLVAIFKMVKDKMERMIVCLKCSDILNKENEAV